MTDIINEEPVTKFFETTIRHLYRNPVKGAEVSSYAALQSVICAQEKWEELTANSFSYAHNLETFNRWVDEVLEETVNGRINGYALVKDYLVELEKVSEESSQETSVA